MSPCNLCRRETVERLIEFGEHPIAHQFLDSPDQDEYTHPLVLGFCESCGLTQLIEPIPPERLYSEYNWLSSWKWNPHQERVLEAIEALPDVGRHDFVLEAGSNDGSFLAALRDRGYTSLLGLEPASDAVAAARERRIETLHDYLTPAKALELVESRGRTRLFLARQVLEHISDLSGLAEAMRILLEDGARVVIEVPDFGFNQKAFDYSAIWEEHVNHFTEATLARFLAEAEVEVEHCETALFSGQALIVFGRATGAPAPSGPEHAAGELRTSAQAFRERWPKFREDINGYLLAQRAGGRRVGVYGAGCRSSTLINICGLREHLEYVVDDQAEKQGRFMPGSRLPVLAPERLIANGDGLDLCLLAVNAENEDRVIERRRDFTERGGEFVSLHPPSQRLPSFWNRG
jgi:hypothetical protein